MSVSRLLRSFKQSRRPDHDDYILLQIEPDLRPEQNARRVRSLADNIQHCLEILENARAAIPAKIARKKKRLSIELAISSTLTLGIVISLPTLLFLLIDANKESYQRLLPDWLARLNAIKSQENYYWEGLQNATAYTGHLPYELIARNYHDAYETAVKCGFYPYGSYRDDNHTRGFVSAQMLDRYCNHNITEILGSCYTNLTVGCETINSDPTFINYLAANREERAWNNNYSHYLSDATLANERNTLEYSIDHPWTPLTIDFRLLIAFVSTCVVGCIILGICVFRSLRSHEKYKHKLQHGREMQLLLQDPIEANEMVNTAARFKIEILDNTQVDALIDLLRTELQNINERWKMRTAFLGGTTRPESTSYRFFHTPGHREVLPIIMGQAGLLPARSFRK